MKVSSYSQRYLFTYSVFLSSLSAISILRTLWGQGTKLELFDHLSLEGNIVNYEGKQQFALLRIFNLTLVAWFRHNQTGLENPRKIASSPEKSHSSQHFPDPFRKWELHSQRFSILCGLHESRKRKKKNNSLKGTLKGPLLRNENWKQRPVNLKGGTKSFIISRARE